MNEHDGEPIHGLPGLLPAGEHILWQGTPRWQSLAVRAFHVRKVALYFAALVLWRVVSQLAEGQGPAGAAMAGLGSLPLAGAGLGILSLLAWLCARTTVYTVTNRRVVMRIGVALPMTLNLPFRVIGSAALSRHRDGTGDLPLSLQGEDRIAWLHLWPHARPWHFGRPQPMLRGLPDPERAAQVLGEALAAAAVGVALPEVTAANEARPGTGAAPRPGFARVAASA